MKLNSHKQALLKRLREGAVIYRDPKGKLRLSDNRQQILAATFHKLVQLELIEPTLWQAQPWASLPRNRGRKSRLHG
jgi:hypothetical protein